MDTNKPQPAQPEIPSELHELPRDKCWQLVRDSLVGRLAVVHEDAPDIFPVSFVVDHATVVLRTAAGTKHDSARNHIVAFEVDGYDLDAAEAWSVVLRGRATEVYAMDEAIEIMNLPLSPWAPGSKPHLLRITPDVVTGRRFAIHGRAPRA